MRTAETDQLCVECWKRAVDCFGTAQIFKDRAKVLRRKLDTIAYLGVAVPTLVGAFVMSFGKDALLLPGAIATAAVLGLIQLAWSLWAIVGQWSTRLEYFQASTESNHRLSEEFRLLGQSAPEPSEDFKYRFAALVAEDQARRGQDERQHVSNAELRKGHRYGLRQFRRACVECKQVPSDMKPTSCGICGSF